MTGVKRPQIHDWAGRAMASRPYALPFAGVSGPGPDTPAGRAAMRFHAYAARFSLRMPHV